MKKTMKIMTKPIRIEEGVVTGTQDEAAVIEARKKTMMMKIMMMRNTMRRTMKMKAITGEEDARVMVSKVAVPEGDLVG